MYTGTGSQNNNGFNIKILFYKADFIFTRIRFIWNVPVRNKSIQNKYLKSTKKNVHIFIIFYKKFGFYRPLNK